MREIPSTWMRGGTSKCWVFERDNLQVARQSIDEVLLRLYGSPEPRQVDGVGGGDLHDQQGGNRGADRTTDRPTSTTRSPRSRSNELRVDWGSNCGNCSAVVGP